MPFYKKKPFLVICITLLVVISAIALIVTTSFHDVAIHLLSADAIWVLLIVAAQSFAYWAYVIPYKMVFKMSFKEAKLHAFEGFQPLKAGSGFVYDMGLHKPLGAQARVYYLGIWEYAALAPAVLIAAIYAYINSSVPVPLSLPWIIGVPVGAALFVIGVSNRTRIAKFPRAHKLLDFMMGMLKDQDWQQMVLLIIGMAGYWTGEIFALWASLQLFDIKLSWVALLIAYATGYSLSRRSLPLGGAGIVLVSLSFSLHWVGAAMSVALLAALAYQVSNLVTPFIYHRASTTFTNS